MIAIVELHARMILHLDAGSELNLHWVPKSHRSTYLVSDFGEAIIA
jgi:hypothetical protein